MQNKSTEIFFDQVQTPTGEMLLAADGKGNLLRLLWNDSEAKLRRHYEGTVIRKRRDPFGLSSALRDYMKGETGIIDTLPVTFAGSDFQNKVWRALRAIPSGTTSSYGELATRIGIPGAARAVGLANGANPVCVVVPCHRVIGANGSLTGFGGGLNRKRWLLAHEDRHVGFRLRA
ncbi:MAG TPA: methylated-DNA--[protein]-cysteine S-methyltransferase [Rhizomicrobium sp.]